MTSVLEEGEVVEELNYDDDPEQQQHQQQQQQQQQFASDEVQQHQPTTQRYNNSEYRRGRYDGNDEQRNGYRSRYSQEARSQSPRRRYDRTNDRTRSPSSSMSRGNEPRSTTRLYIRGIADSVTSSQITELFGTYGPVIEATVLKDSRTGISRHCGFVEFKEDEHAAEAAKSMQGHTIDGMSFDIEFAIPMPEEAVYHDRLYVSQLPAKTSEADLRELCEPFGEVSEITINTQHYDRQNAGQPQTSENLISAFVQFTSADAASKAQSTLNGTFFSDDSTGPRISVAMARKYRSRRPHSSSSYRGYGNSWQNSDYGDYSMRGRGRGGRGRGRGGGYPPAGFYGQYAIPPMPYEGYFHPPMYAMPPMYYPPVAAAPVRGGGFRRGGMHRDSYGAYESSYAPIGR